VGNISAAALACLAGLNAARAIGDEPNVISQKIRMAGTAVACRSTQRLLAQVQPEPAELEALQRAFTAEDAPNVLRVGMRGERALRQSLLEAIEAGDAPPTALMNGNPSEPPWTMRFLTELDRDQVRDMHPLYLSLMAPRVEASRMPPQDQDVADKSFDAACRALLPDGSLAMVLVPWIRDYSQACRLHHATVRCLSTALAVERYRRAQGRWPDSLEPLAGLLPPSLAVDPYNGQPLHLKRLADGLVIYSVGPDGIDNGGRLNSPGPGRRGGLDVGTRLWDVDRRGVP
jgi:hypothetical protein